MGRINIEGKGLSVQEQIHIRLSNDILAQVQSLVDKGLFSNKNEAIRYVIREMLLKYKDLQKNDIDQ